MLLVCNCPKAGSITRTKLPKGPSCYQYVTAQRSVLLPVRHCTKVRLVTSSSLRKGPSCCQYVTAQRSVVLLYVTAQRSVVLLYVTAQRSVLLLVRHCTKVRRVKNTSLSKSQLSLVCNRPEVSRITSA